MARVRWGEKKKRFIETGVSKGVLYPKGKTGVVWNGLTGVSESSSGGEVIDLFADNIKYCSFRSAESYEATIEAYTYPDEFMECDGSLELSDGVRIGQQKRLPFDFCFRSELLSADGNPILDGYKIHLIYNATASPSEKSYETINDSPDAVTFSWEVQTTPFVLNGHRAASTIVIDTTKADRIAIEALEEILYGTKNVSPRMPDPDEVLSILTRLDIQRMFMDLFSKSGRWIWDTFNFKEDTVPIAIDRESERRTIFNPTSETEYPVPSIAYALVDEENGRKKYMVIAIVDEEESGFISDLESTVEMTKLGVTQSGDLYYHRYYLYS